MKIAFLVSDLTTSHQTVKLINNINICLSERYDVDISIFYENFTLPCIKQNFAISNSLDAYNYSGNLIATDIKTAKKLINFPVTKNKYFHINNLEWININNKSFEDLASVYQNKKIKLLTRSQEYKNQINKIWNTQVRSIIHDFNINEIIKVVKEDEND